MNYLKYLLYWKRPEYAVYLKYPQALYFLEVLQVPLSGPKGPDPTKSFTWRRRSFAMP